MKTRRLTVVIAAMAMACSACLAQTPLQFFAWTSVGKANGAAGKTVVPPPNYTDTVYVAQYGGNYSYRLIATNNYASVGEFLTWGSQYDCAMDKSNRFVSLGNDGYWYMFDSSSGAQIYYRPLISAGRCVVVDNKNDMFMTDSWSPYWIQSTNGYARFPLQGNLGWGPWGVCVDKNGDVWVNYNTVAVLGRFHRVDENTWSFSSVASRATGGSALCAGNGDDKIWACSGGGYVSSYDVATTSRVDYSVGSVGSSAYGICVDKNNDVWYSNNTDSKIYRLPAANRAAVQSYDTAGGAFHVAVDNIGNVWVANVGANSVSKFDAVTMARTDYVTAATPTGVACHFIWWW